MGNPDELPSLAEYLSIFPFAAFGAPDDDDDDEEEEEEEDEPPAKKGGDEKDQRISELSKEAKKRRLENKDLKKQNEEILEKLKAFEDKDKTDAERHGTRVAELEKRLAQVEPMLTEQAAKLAFFESGMAAKFQNPGHALRLLDLSDVDVEDGVADAASIKEKAEALLKEAPYLTVTAGGGNGSSDDDGKGGSTEKVDTTGAGEARGKGGRKTPDNAALVERFPALAGRVPVTQPKG